MYVCLLNHSVVSGPVALIDCRPLDSSVHGVVQTRTLKWVATSSSRGPSPSRHWTSIPCVSCIGRLILYHWANWEAPPYHSCPKPRDKTWYIQPFLFVWLRCVYIHRHTPHCFHPLLCQWTLSCFHSWLLWRVLMWIFLSLNLALTSHSWITRRARIIWKFQGRVEEREIFKDLDTVE